MLKYNKYLNFILCKCNKGQKKIGVENGCDFIFLRNYKN